MIKRYESSMKRGLASHHRCGFVFGLFIALFSVMVFSVPASASGFVFAPLSEEFLAEDAGREAGDVGDTYYGVSHLDLSHLKEADYSKFLAGAARGAALPGKYDLRTYGWTTPAKTQSYNNCWAYSAVASLESTYLRKTGTALDLSEQHLAWFSANGTPSFTRTFYNGGYDNIAVAMLARWSGAALERDAPERQQPSGNADSYANRLHLEDAFFLGLQFQGTFDRPTHEVMKRLVYDYGGISVGICMASEGGQAVFYEAANDAWYYNGTRTRPDHAVLLVGWDDDYPRTNFRADNRPQGNGAWLARNHQGTTFGDRGFFWVSYEDVSFGDGTVYLAGETSNFDNNYGYDELGWCKSVGDGASDTMWLANVFTSGSTKEQVEAVSFYTTANAAAYEISIYTGLSDLNDPSSGTAASSQRGDSDFAGYHTVRLATPVSLPAGSTFAVVVKMTTPGYLYPVAVETAVEGYSDNATSKTGESFVSSDGHDWSDAKTTLSANVCVRAFTVTEMTPTPPTDPNGDSGGGGGCSAGLPLAGLILAGCLVVLRRKAGK